MSTVGQIVEALERFAPPALAADWDNVGLLLGDRAIPVERLLTCLTVTPDVVVEAVAERVNLIVSHHPILFRPVKRLSTDTSEGRLLLPLLAAGVAVYSPHTAFDNTVGGINDLLATRLELLDVVPLRRRPFAGPGECKLVVFVPDADLAKVSDALFAAGAGRIGQYRECSFRLAGTGTFFGGDTTNPTVGQKGRREDVSEWRLEVICPEAKVPQVVAALRRAHSYEEPAFDVYPLRSTALVGEGRIGSLPTVLPLSELAGRTKTALSATFIQMVGSTTRSVERVAIVCGAGGDFVSDAVRAGADVLLTGEARFHDVLAAEAAGLALLLPGHYATERIGIEDLAVRLAREWPGVTVWPSRREHDPLGVA